MTTPYKPEPPLVEKPTPPRRRQPGSPPLPNPGDPPTVEEKQAVAQLAYDRFAAIGYGFMDRPRPPVHVDEFGRPLMHEMFPEQYLRAAWKSRGFFGRKVRW